MKIKPPDDLGPVDGLAVGFALGLIGWLLLARWVVWEWLSR
jgi:hypothetical protein